jgi:hypothetical protein
MTQTLQKRHGAALITWINRHILTADIPADSGLGTGPTVRLQVGSRLCIAYSLHLLNQPITCAALAEAGGGSPTTINYTFNYLVSRDVLGVVVKLSGNVGGRTHQYHFTERFAEQINKLHTGIGTDGD